jgi:hypothetical protein
MPARTTTAAASDKARTSPGFVRHAATVAAQPPEGGIPFPSRSIPFPADLLDRAMPHLTDTEWRLLCVVVRQTLGWRDAATGGRKGRDWLTQSQLTRRTGRSGKPVSQAISGLVGRGLIRVLSDQGLPLLTAAERRRYQGRHWFQLDPQWTEAVRDLEGRSAGENTRGEEAEEDAAQAEGARGLGLDSLEDKARRGLSTAENVPTTKETLYKRKHAFDEKFLSSGESTYPNLSSPSLSSPSLSSHARHSQTKLVKGSILRPEVRASRLSPIPRLSLDDVLTVFGASEPIIRQSIREHELQEQERSEGSQEGLPRDAAAETTGSSPSRWRWSKDKKLWINSP